MTSVDRMSQAPVRRPLTSHNFQQGQEVTKLQTYLMLGMMISLFLPVILYAGSVALPVPRLYVLLLFIPAAMAWARGQSGAKHPMDYLIIVFSLWTVVSLLIVHGVSSLQFSGSTAIEIIGSYFVGRWCVRNKEGFLRFVRFQLLLLILLLPFAVMEALSGDPVIIRFFSAFAPTQTIIDYEQRLGLHRVQAVFQHPILYGYFAAVTTSLVIYGLNLHGKLKTQLLRVGVVGVSTFLSLSSGPLGGMIMQMLLTVWERISRGYKGRWAVVIITVIIMYVVVDVLSNRTPFHVFVSYMTLNSGTAYYRILIFQYGWDNVLANPLFGLGMNDWVRPHWMPPSVDNLFLAWAMRHGFPGLIMLFAIFLTLIIGLGRKTYANADISSIRTGVNFSLIGTMIIGATVFLWGPVFIWLWFFIGACMWLFEEQPSGDETEEAAPVVQAPTSPFTRFAQNTIRSGPHSSATKRVRPTGPVRTTRKETIKPKPRIEGRPRRDS